MRNLSSIGVLLVAASLLTAVACGGGGKVVRVTITSPNDGATITIADDVDPAADGIQIAVLVAVENLDPGEQIRLIPGSAAMSQAELQAAWAGAASELLGEDGTVVFDNVLVAGSGDFQITACARECADSDRVDLVIEAPPACPAVTFVSPPAPPPGGVLVLGPSENSSGTGCDGTFTTDVSVSTDAPTGATATLYVNGAMAGTASVSGLVAEFRNVVLDGRGDTRNTIEIEITAGGLPTCDRIAYTGQIEVDCAGVSCQITAPDASMAFLNAADDTSTDADFQTDFVIGSEAEAVGQTLTLVVDGDEGGALTSAAVAAGMGAEATFGPVTLTEGTHRVQGICQDDAGNVTRSATAEWVIDITACSITLDAPVADTIFIDADDLDGATAGIQIDVAGTVSGAGCASVQVGVCGGALTDAVLDGGAYTGLATLPTTTGSHDLCAEVTDDAGNVGVLDLAVAVEVNSDAPQLLIVTPTTPTAAYNIAGTVDGDGITRTADLDAATTTCEAAFTVNCDRADLSVDLVRGDTMTVIATATCVATGGLSAPYVAQAAFAMAPLPSLDSGASYSVTAEATADRLLGVSTAVSVTADCSAPSLAISRPAGCLGSPAEAVLRPALDDEDPVAVGVQHRVTVVNTNDPAPCVDLTVGGSTEPTSCVRVGATNSFVDADFGAGGDLAVVASAMDAAGNTESFTCNVRVADLPTVNITSPPTGASLGAAQDCDAGTAGMQILITGSTDAPPSATASVTVAGGASQPITLMGPMAGPSTWSACVDSTDFSDQPVVVTIDRGGDAAMASVTISVDGTVPDVGVTTLEVASTVDRRGGEVRFRWTDVEDAGGAGPLASYEMRCADGPITDEAGWTAATAFPLTRTPMTAGTVSTEDVTGFRITDTFHCMVRGSDGVDQLTPLGNSVMVNLDFLVQAVGLAGTTGLGESFAAVGDINGDGIDDVVVSGANPAAIAGSAVYLYFGSITGLATSPSVTITGETAFGAVVAALGDFNDDGENDFVVGSPAQGGGNGAAFVFFGRPSTSPWPAAIDASGSTCGADVCYRGTDGFGFLGGGVSSAGDFDGDGVPDLLAGAAFGAGFVGAAYVILGGTVAAGTTFEVPASTGTEPDGFTINAPGGQSQFGVSVATVGDVTGDGRSEVVIGAPGDGAGGTLGAVDLVQGSAYSGSGLVAAGAATTVATGAAGVFATRVVNVGDFDRNGQIDIGVYSGIATQGRVHVYLGMAGGYSSADEVRFMNDVTSPANDFMGYLVGTGHVPSVGSHADLDGDGAADVLFGSIERGGAAEGSAELFFGSMSTADRSRSAADASYAPAPTTGSASRSAGFVGDVNGDGAMDFAVGDPTGSSGAGEFWIRY